MLYLLRLKIDSEDSELSAVLIPGYLFPRYTISYFAVYVVANNFGTLSDQLDDIIPVY